MPRRIALALSFALTIVVAFAVASFASRAGWLQAEPDTELANAQDTSPAPQLPPDSGLQQPLVVTEYVYQDIPVVVSRAQEGTNASAVAPEPTPIVVLATQDNVQPTVVAPTAIQVNDPAPEPTPALIWSHDGDGEDSENFGDEIQDNQQQGEQEHEHESEHEREGDDD
jgi:hypothetical protein